MVAAAVVIVAVAAAVEKKGVESDAKDRVARQTRDHQTEREEMPHLNRKNSLKQKRTPGFHLTTTITLPSSCDCAYLLFSDEEDHCRIAPSGKD